MTDHNEPDTEPEMRPSLHHLNARDPELATYGLTQGQASEINKACDAFLASRGLKSQKWMPYKATPKN